MKFKKKTYRLFSYLTHPSVRIGFFLSCFFLIFMYLILLVEQKSNPNLQTFFDAFWYTFVTITTIGYGDITPHTILGRVLAIIIMASGVIFFGAVSGKIASVFFDRQQKREKGLLTLKRKQEHCLICGWKPDMEALLLGIISSNPDMIPSDFVLVNSAGQDQMYPIISNAAFRGINYINGDYSDEETLVRANIKKANKIIVLSDYSKPYSTMEMDSRTVLAVILMKKMHRTVYIAAELIDEKFKKHLENEHCDEIILSKQYERNMIVRASSGLGVSHVLDKLFSGEQGEGLQIAEVPPEFIGKTFFDLSTHFFTTEHTMLVGLLENTGNYFNRKQEALAEAQKNPDINAVVNNLKKVKEMKSNKTLLAPPQNYTVKKYSRAILIAGKTHEKDVANEYIYN